MENDASSATRKLCTAVLAALLISAASPALAGDVDPKPGEGKSKDTSPAPAGEVGRRPGEGNPPASDSDTPPPPPPSSKPSPQRFEPTEKVRPDFDVAFPVDI